MLKPRTKVKHSLKLLYIPQMFQEGAYLADSLGGSGVKTKKSAINKASVPLKHDNLAVTRINPFRVKLVMHMCSI